MMYSIVQLRDGGYSLARIDTDYPQIQWWCGKHGWVSPHSGWWQVASDCWNEVFETPKDALNACKRITGEPF